MNRIWNELLEFETRDLIERFMRKKFGRETSSRKIYQITSNFIQSREYFKSAENSNITVRPLLQYYGVMALSKALILALNFSQTEEQLKPSHGLVIKNWKKIIKTKEFEFLEISVGDGTFSELIKSTENRNYLRANSSAVNWMNSFKNTPKGSGNNVKAINSIFS